MRSVLTRLTSGLATVVGSAALFCGLGSTASAQYHAVYGGGRDDAAEGGIIETKEGEFVSVGYSDSFGNDRDVYVVKTTRCGALRWARTYDFGGADVGKKIRLTDDGGYVVVGSTENLNNCCTQNDAFLMKLTPDGDVQWARTLGGADDDQGADVQVSGDNFYFTGRTNSFGRGDYDGWLGAVNSAGDLLWSRVYGGEAADGFNSLALGCGDNSILAAGDTRSYTDAGDMDIFVVKTDLNGLIPGLPFWSNHYGGDADELAWSITNYKNELFYVAGYTESVGNGREGYLLEGICDNGARRADIAYGGANVGLDDEFTEIQVNPYNGNLALTGFMQDPPGGLGGYDVWLAEVTPGLATVAPLPRIYGGDKDDQGWSLVVTEGIYDKYDYVMAGWTDSYQVFGNRDLYQVRADQNGKSGCHEGEPKLQKKVPGFKANEAPTWTPLVRVICRIDPEVRRNEEFKYICNSCKDDGLNVPGNEELSMRNAIDADQPRAMTVAVAPQAAK